MGIKLTEKGWNEEGDRNKTTDLIRNEFFDEEKGQFPTDIANEINKRHPEWESKLTPDDVVDYVLGFTKDKKGQTEKIVELRKLSDKFKDLTGRSLELNLANRLVSDNKVSPAQQALIEEMDIALNEAT